MLEDHADILADFIHGKGGIYALYKRDRLYYVGLASSLKSRLSAHRRDRHAGKWDRFSVYLTKDDAHIKELESLLLRIVDPKGNRVKGKFTKARDRGDDLRKRWNRAKRTQEAHLFGGKTQKRHQRRRASSSQGLEALAGVFPRGVSLKAWRDGWEFTARLRTDGTIHYDGDVYTSPRAAATAALGKPSNGWAFWCYRDKKGEWVPLRTLRKPRR